MCVVRKNACSVLKANDKLFEKGSSMFAISNATSDEHLLRYSQCGDALYWSTANFKTEKNVEDVERSVAFPWVDCREWADSVTGSWG